MPPRDYYLPQRRLVSQEDAAVIERPSVPRSRFTGAWTRKTTFDAGYLVPILVDEVLPGDHLSYQVTAYVRMSTPLFPIFDNQRVDTFFFFVPNRIVWTNWVKFMGEQTDPTSSIDFTIPQLTSSAGGFAVGSLADHMGLPTAGQVDPALDINVNALPFRAYNLIYNLWFRDQNIIDSETVPLTDNGTDALADYNLLRRAKSHDYFTSALPWPQKFTAPNVPVAGIAPIIGLGIDSASANANAGPIAVNETSQNLNYPFYFTDTVNNFVMRSATDTGNDNPAIYADLAAATGVAINTFRQAFLVQSLLERDARGGTRYVELIRAHFDVVNPDFRLQRPEYIGGGQTPLIITPVAQTTPADDLPVGALGAAGTAAGSHNASYAATEHGYIIGLINVRSEISYQQGIHKMWSRETRFDFYWPSLAQLGEQAILRQEIYARGNPDLDEAVFGYQERWQEYRTRYSEVTGEFRSTATGNIDEWHLAQEFSAPPTLNAAFINDDPPMARILAAGSAAAGQQYLADILYQRNAVRPIPMFGTPANLGRF